MTLETTKNLGGIGALLMFITPLITWFVPYAGILAIIGYILLLVALKGLTDFYNESGIFNNALYSFILAVVGGIVVVAVVVLSVLGAMTSVLPVGFNFTDPNAWQSIDWASFVTNIWNVIVPIITGLIVLFIFMILVAFLMRRSLDLAKSKTGVGLFGTAGLLMLIGAVLVIALGIGLILVWISILLVAIAFWQIRTATTPPSPPSAPPPT